MRCPRSAHARTPVLRELQPTVPDAPFATAEVGGVPFAITDLPSAATWFLDEVRAGRPPIVRLANAYCIALTRSDRAYTEVMLGPGVNLPDGWWVSAALHLLRSRREARQIRGTDFMRFVIGASATDGPRHFLLGGTPEILDRLSASLRALNPDVALVGRLAPPFAPLSPALIDEMAAAVERARPDIVWVGLGTPKQDHVAAAMQLRTGAAAVGVGAAFDFLAGTRREAPVWVQRVGLEWLHRLVLEPRRLGSRYLLGNTVFVWMMVVETVRSHGGRSSRS